MTVNRIVRIVAGFFIMLSLALAHFTGQVDLATMSWLWFTLFVGANLFQSGFTTFCPLDSILKKLGVPETAPGCKTGGCG
ncbi:MAG: YgaP family membrane protein [Rhodocyclaceae bacterium]